MDEVTFVLFCFLALVVSWFYQAVRETSFVCELPSIVLLPSPKFCDGFRERERLMIVKVIVTMFCL